MDETTATPDARVRENFGQQRVMRLIGAELTRVTPGEVWIELPFRPDLTQQHGYLHAGIIATVLDSACGYAAYTLMPPGSSVLSVEFKANLLAPAAGERLIARARVLRAGRTITVCQADGFMRSGDAEHLVATMVGTMIRGRAPESAAGSS
jgi:uncharacterized protein (TIGR00369 family)